jgi:hypothetical protein
MKYLSSLFLPLASVIVALTTTCQATVNVSVLYQVQSDWGSGFVANWYLTNNGTTTLSNWVFEFDQPIGSFQNTWSCAVLGSSTATHKVLTNMGYNANIAPGGSITFGYQASPGGLIAPTNYILNGVPLSGNPAIPALSIADASLPEGDSGSTAMNFTVTLSAPATNTVSVNYATAAGTATADVDFTSTSGTLTFNAGVTQQVLSVFIYGDTNVEPDETFTVALSSPANATLARANATGTIVNDDFTPNLTVNDPSLYEGDSGTNYVAFTLSLDRAPALTASVQVATADITAAANSDYVPLAQTVTFAPGEVTKTVLVGILGDTNAELTETFALNLSSPVNAVIVKAQGVCTIFDNDANAHGKVPIGAYSYAEVLQKSMFFYECQRSGILPASNRVTWRGNSATGDGSDVGRDLTGGWFDAGDHVKFGFPMAGSATMLAWAGLEYPQAFDETGQMNSLLDNLKWVCDYFIKCNILDGNGDTLEFYGQVGDGSADHAFWGPPEVMTMARPSYKVTRNAPGSDLCGETAAALAASSMLFQSSNPSYAATLLSHARKLYAFADAYRGKYSDSINAAQGYYTSWSGYMDELMWGALWLYRATGESSYLTKAQTAYNSIFAGNWGDQSYPSLKWTHAWDDKSYGSLVLFSMLTTNTGCRVNAERWLDFWTIGRPDGRVTYTPGGLAWLDPAGWGNLRYAMNTAFLAFLYSDRVSDHTNRYHNFAISQVNYALGSNPLNRSFVCGFGNNPPVKPHHRADHGSWDNNIQDPPDSRHILCGALVGGPGGSDDYTDARDNYVLNEVACDYNAGFSGALAKMYLLYGGYTQPDFPVVETPTNQFFVQASINQSNANFTEIRALLQNHSAWPARASTNLHYRYFFDLSELYAAGGSTNNVTVSVNMLDGGTISGLRPWDVANHIYYVELNYDGVNIIPGGSTSYRREAQFRLAIPNSFPAAAWNPNNDFSYQNLVYGNQNVSNTVYIPTYENGVKLEGQEPPLPGSYQQWRLSKFTAADLTDPAVSGDSADPNQNGLPNLLEYALGLDPKVSDPSLLPRLQLATIGGQPAAVLTCTISTTATEATAVLEESTDLKSWSTAVTQEISRTSVAGRDTLQLRLHPTEPLLPQLYLRLRAQRLN